MREFGELFSTFNWLTAIKLGVQVMIISYFLLWGWRRIRGTQAERLVKGIMVLVGFWVISHFVGFTLVTSILQHIVPVAVLAVFIIFQPELRRGLGYLGRMKSFKVDLSLPNSAEEKVRQDIAHIITAVRELSRAKIGALLVVEPPEGERDYLSPGTPINADLSATLLLTIFFPNSPLHDGAVVLRQDKIVAAGVILPMSEDPKLSYKYGTRHRAAIGLSETYDGLCIVVSEETGQISAASRGMLVRYNDATELHDPLMYLYHEHTTNAVSNPLNSFLTLFGRGRKETGAEEIVQSVSATLDTAVNVNSQEVPPDAQTGVDPRLSGDSDSTLDLAPLEPEQVL